MSKKKNDPSAWMVQQSAIAAINNKHNIVPNTREYIPTVSTKKPPAPVRVRNPVTGGYSLVDPNTSQIVHPVAPPNLAVSSRTFGGLGSQVGSNGQRAGGGSTPVTKKTPPATKKTTPTATKKTPPKLGGVGSPTGSGGNAGGVSGGVSGGVPAGQSVGSGSTVITKKVVKTPDTHTQTHTHAYTPPDPISQQIAGQLQQQQRLADYYTAQTDALRNSTAAQGVAQAGAYQTGPQIAGGHDDYAAMLNALGNAQAGGNAANQSSIANLLAGNESANQMAGVEYARRLKADEPKMRMDQQAADADASMKAAEQQYLQDKLGLSARQAADQSNQGWTKIGDARTNAANNLVTKQNAAYTAQQKALAAKALAGQKMSAAQRQHTQAWIDKHLFAKNATTGVLEQVTDVPYTTILDQLGSYSGPMAAAQAAIVYSPSTIKRLHTNTSTWKS